ncbi:MAG: energy transducer TonB [Bacteroidaceae bacterium]|nr:energy transducer TonB [Bacteroidaceae bacterium]
MKHIILFLLLFVLAMAPVCSSSAQDNQDEIVMPQFPGGEAELHKYIISELEYPLDARLNNEKGEVLVAFSVGMDGYITGVRVVRSVSKSLDAEAVRVVSKMPPWIPGKKNGRPVRAEMSIPINFKVIYENKFTDENARGKKTKKTKFRY